MTKKGTYAPRGPLSCTITDEEWEAFSALTTAAEKRAWMTQMKMLGWTQGYKTRENTERRHRLMKARKTAERAGA